MIGKPRSIIVIDFQVRIINSHLALINCVRCLEPRKALPNFKTDEPVCPDGELQCGNGQCLSKSLFCDEQVDCQDGSDENACNVDQVDSSLLPSLLTSCCPGS